MKRTFLFFLSLVLTSHITHGQNSTTTLYCPNPGDIKLSISIEDVGQNKKEVFSDQFSSVKQMLADEELNSLQTLIQFLGYENKWNDACFQIKFKSMPTYNKYSKDIRFVYVEYLSEKNFKSQVKIKFDALSGDSSSYINN